MVVDTDAARKAAAVDAVIPTPTKDRAVNLVVVVVIVVDVDVDVDVDVVANRLFPFAILYRSCCFKRNENRVLVLVLVRTTVSCYQSFSFLVSTGLHCTIRHGTLRRYRINYYVSILVLDRIVSLSRLDGVKSKCLKYVMLRYYGNSLQ